MKDKVKRFLLKMVAKKIVDKTGKEQWQKSNAKIGAVIAVTTFIIHNVLPAWGIDIKLPDEIFQLIEILGLGQYAYGTRAAQERVENKLIGIKEE